MRPGRSPIHAHERRRRHWRGPDAPPVHVLSAVQAQIEARRGERGMRPGAALLGAVFFVRFGAREVVVAAPWGDSFGAWRFEPLAPDARWRPIEPWLDLAGLNLGALVRGSESRAPNRYANWRQGQLELGGDSAALGSNERAAALQAALASVPDWARRQVVRVRPHEQWPLLGLLNAGGRPAAELCADNPALAYLLATRAALEPIERLLARRRTAILAALGVPSGGSTVRILERVEPAALDARLIGNLLRWLGDARARKRLAHSERIGPALAHFQAPRDAAWLAPKALREALACCDARRLSRLGGGVRLVGALRRLGYDPPRQLESLDQLESWCDLLRERKRKLGGEPAGRLLGASPYVGVPGAIEPIRTVGELLDEADAMAHCAFDYRPEAVQGDLAFYRVLRPERATLALCRLPGRRRWSVESMKRRANAEPSSETYRYVHRWIAWCVRGQRPPRTVDGRQLELRF